MTETAVLTDLKMFSVKLFPILRQFNPGIEKLEPYEFRYCLDNLVPVDGWDNVPLLNQNVLEDRLRSRQYFEQVQLNPIRGGHIVLDEKVRGLTQMLFWGLVVGKYAISWVNQDFYFDLRSFLFYPRTQYYSPEVFEHFGGKPFRQFRQTQSQFAGAFDIGYADFKRANQEVDQAFIQTVQQLIQRLGKPILITLAGPTGAGKTEITSRLSELFYRQGCEFSSLEVDNFFKDREYRDAHITGPEIIHFEIFKRAIDDLLCGKPTTIPRYDFYKAVSSHDLESNLRPNCTPIEIEPADIVFLEGNFPFHIPEVAPLIGLKIVYLTDDPRRLQRKWKRDIDYRKKYDPVAFCNRFFRTQFLRAEDIYRPLMQVCDMIVDTTAATLWLTPKLVEVLG